MKTFYVGIKGVIVQDSKVLLLRANHKNGRSDMWEVPGGRIDGDETIEQALRRELKEELPNIYSIKVGKVLDTYRLHRDIDGDRSLVLIFYRVSAKFKDEPQLSDEHIDWQWADQAEALKIVNESCRQAIKNTFQNNEVLEKYF